MARPFVAPATPYSAGHRGVDLQALWAGAWLPRPPVSCTSRGCVVDRPVLSIRHPGGVISSYEPVESDLVAGDAVSRGDVIGRVMAGHCATVCLHLGVRVDGEYVSPMLYLGEVPRSVLLPTRALG